ncbi:MAG TPA: hypothetical protein VHX13_04115 [Acidobacteriaceae bacterium]|jgi:hypothetical protein|nr:hypothetical protein [Acidobacteriaceae bacterium]
MTETPMDLIRKLDETATALADLAAQVRRAADAVTDGALRQEMLESADGMQTRAERMAEAIGRWRLTIQ